MANAIAFFPWVAIDEPLTIGPVRLLPYERGRLPVDQPNASQADIDGVLSAYALRKDQLVQDATLLELGDWHLGQDAEAHADALFRARALIAFAALARRRLFRGHFDYCNADTYALVIQNYQADSPGTFSFSTRRRDGGTRNLWSADEFAFLKPLHVPSNAKVKVDEPLLAALLAANDAGRLPLDAISEFNRANTDSQDVPIHTELVMTKSAFEYFFDIGHEANEFVAALLPLVSDREGRPDGPLARRWKERFPKAGRPLEAWAREFCALRGGAAHGQRRGGDHFLWAEHAHLAFASILFPLLVKQRLARDGFLELAERNAIELEWIEAYLMHDPFEVAAEPRQHLREHPWSRVYSEDVLGEVLRRGIQEELDRGELPSTPEPGSKRPNSSRA